MLKNNFDHKKPYRYVIYARMSSKQQNERSPEQQVDEIERRIRQQGLNWKHVKTFKDIGKKGSMIRNRPEFSKMMNEIRSGQVSVDLIIVDTIDRFARSDETSAIRSELRKRYGVLVVTAESNFADPETPQGRAYSMVDSLRASEENRIKSHQVKRGKIDSIHQKKWPGGPVPFGYTLEKSIVESDCKEKIETKLVPDENAKWIIRKAFERTLQTGDGPDKVARFLNSQPDLPCGLDISGSKVGYWLRNTIYKGVLTWAANSTGIVDDVRVLQANDPEDICIEPDFCVPIVDPKLWDDVASLRHSRRRIPSQDASDEKEIAPLVPGIKVRFMLSGLVYCGNCGRSMRPLTGGFVSKTGRTYSYFECFRKKDGGCKNQTTFPIEWLDSEVVGFLKSKLLTGARRKASILELMDSVDERLKEIKRNIDDPRTKLKRKIEEIGSKVSGWVQTLSNPGLAQIVRQKLESEMEESLQQKSELELQIRELDEMAHCESTQVDIAMLEDHLDRLSELLSNSNPTLVNLELSLFIDRIDCFEDGTAKAKFCMLGLAGHSAIDGLAALDCASEANDSAKAKFKARRRSRRKTEADIFASDDIGDLAFWAADPDRFADLGEHWFESVTFTVPEPTFWAKENAIAVSELRLHQNMTHEQLAEKFGVTVPTIRKALKLGKEMDPKYRQIPRKMPRARWHEDHAQEVYLANQTMMMKEMVARFSKSDVTLRKALSHARDILGLE